MGSVIIGVLALQGDFAKHIETLQSLGVKTKEVRKPEDLDDCDALIIPGGESTVISRRIDFIQMRKTLVQFAEKKPLFGTCAGLILMAHEVESAPFIPLKLLDIKVERNAYGRQVESFQAPIELQLEPNHPKFFRAVFIRAPRIIVSGPEIEILATHNGAPVLVRQGRHLGASFHPELTSDPVIHRYFVELIK